MKKRIMTAGILAMILAMGMTACKKQTIQQNRENFQNQMGKKKN